MKSSNTNASILDLTKHMIASNGLHTIGSPRTLNDVFSRMGHWVRFSNSSSNRANRGLTLECTVWTRAEPSTCVVAGRPIEEVTLQVSSMKGDGWSRSKCSAAFDSKTVGAKGLNAS